MQTAYELKALADKLKAHGLEVSEEAVKHVIVDVCDWVEESAKLSPTPFDDVGLSVLPLFKKAALEVADKIDGKIHV